MFRCGGNLLRQKIKIKKGEFSGWQRPGTATMRPASFRSRSEKKKKKKKKKKNEKKKKKLGKNKTDPRR